MLLNLQTLRQYIAPQNTLSRFAGKMSNCEHTPLKNWLIDWFIKRYGVNMNEALESDPHAYKNFNAFFTRALKPEARPIIASPQTIISPVDGAISQIGAIEKNQLLQAKSFQFDLTALLGGSTETAALFENGAFTTLYLAPKDYHRVHMPLDGTLKKMIHVPGQLFSVNSLTTTQVPGLFARNERVITLFDSPAGPMAIILVGAMLVASIATKWAGIVTPPTSKIIRTWNYDDKKITLKRGEEMGHFELGSTVILLFPSNKISWEKTLTAGSDIRLGSRLADMQ